MGFLKNYVANMGQIAKKLRKSSLYGAALKLCSLLVALAIDSIGQITIQAEVIETMNNVSLKSMNYV